MKFPFLYWMLINFRVKDFPAVGIDLCDIKVGINSYFILHQNLSNSCVINIFLANFLRTVIST